VRAPERLYHLVLKHFYQHKYKYLVCTLFKVYPEFPGLSRKVYPIFIYFSLIQKYQYNIEAISCLAIYGKFPHSKVKIKIGYTFLDRLMINVYTKNKEEQYA
jgi:hypothetical protein